MVETNHTQVSPRNAIQSYHTISNMMRGFQTVHAKGGNWPWYLNHIMKLYLTIIFFLYTTKNNDSVKNDWGCLIDHCVDLIKILRLFGTFQCKYCFTTLSYTESWLYIYSNWLFSNLTKSMRIMMNTRNVIKSFRSLNIFLEPGF